MPAKKQSFRQQAAAQEAQALNVEEFPNRAMRLILSLQKPEPHPEDRRQITFRITDGLLASVDALAGMSAQSRNAMLHELLTIGLESVLSEMDVEMREAYVDAQNEAVNQLG